MCGIFKYKKNEVQRIKVDRIAVLFKSKEGLNERLFLSGSMIRLSDDDDDEMISLRN